MCTPSECPIIIISFNLNKVYDIQCKWDLEKALSKDHLVLKSHESCKKIPSRGEVVFDKNN
jgi:hypothetical protein